MRNPNVLLITTLANLLGQTQERLEEECDNVDRVGHDLLDEQDAHQLTKGTLQALSDENFHLRSKVENMEYREGEGVRRLDQSHINQSLAAVYQILFLSPDKSFRLRAYLTQVGQADFYQNKIRSIKEVRDVTGCGLKECKDFVENFPWEKFLPEPTLTPVPSF